MARRDAGWAATSWDSSGVQERARATTRAPCSSRRALTTARPIPLVQVSSAGAGKGGTGLGCAGDEDDWLGHVDRSESFSVTIRGRKPHVRPASSSSSPSTLQMAAVRAAFSRLASTRTRPSIPVSRAALARSYATQSEHSVCTLPKYLFCTTHATHR
jgi:hypothetical protein